jgi:hypothetical protein
MKFIDLLYFFLGLLGLLLLYSYYDFVKQNKSNLTNLWDRIKSPLKTYYIDSLFLSAFGFLSLLGYLAKTRSLKHNQATTNVIWVLYIIVLLSLFWIPLSLSYLKQGRPDWLKYNIIGILIALALASIYAVSVIKNTTGPTLNKQLAFYGMVYFFCHTFFLDTLLWCGNFF